MLDLQDVRAIKDRVMRQLLCKTRDILESFDHLHYADHWYIIHTAEHLGINKMLPSLWTYVSHDKCIIKCIFNANIHQRLHRLRLSGALNQIKMKGN